MHQTIRAIAKHFGFAFCVLLRCASLGRAQVEIDSTPLSESYKKFREKPRLLYIQNFDNRTFSPQLTGRLKEKLQIAISRNTSLPITPEKTKAELVLSGSILRYSEEPGVYDRAAGPVSFNLEIVVSFRLRTSAQTESEESHSEQHTVRYMTSYSVAAPLFETRFLAEERLLEGLADRMAAAIYEPPRQS